MANFSPRVVDPADLYDGPEPSGGVNFLPPDDEAISGKYTAARSRPDYVATITAALDMLGSRLLALISVIAACGMWGWAVYDPQPQRTYAAIAFSVTVFLPAVALYWRRG